MRLRSLLERSIAGANGGESPAIDAEAPPALQILGEKLGLSSFERDVVMLCAACEFDPEFPSLCAKAQGDPRRPWPTFMLALRALPNADCAALVPRAPLRYMRLVEIGPGESLMSSQLRIDERVLHFLSGVASMDERLQDLVQPVAPLSVLPASYRDIAERIIRVLRAGELDTQWPIVQLTGDATSTKPAVASIACGALGLRLHKLRATQIPATAVEREAFRRLWQREAILSDSALIVDADTMESAAATLSFCAGIYGIVFLSCAQPLAIPDRDTQLIPIEKPGADEQEALWRHALGPLSASLNGELDAIVGDFPMDPARILATAGKVLCDVEPAPGVNLAQRLHNACRIEVKPNLGTVAQQVRAVAAWSDIVLPDFQTSLLHEIVAHVRHRAHVYEHWGFGARTSGLGITALFAGPSGTGKTLAAEILANELQLDLWRIDLSQVVSKWVGDTEKNIKTVFDAADNGGALLLFDEADALYGRRSEVRDSHDRLANIEVSYLLQRMETYRGLAILTTNMKSSLDSSFLRRIRFLVSFPFPDASLRARIWERVFPAGTPTEDIDTGKLARLTLSGGNIRNIALNAAFLAADAGEPVRMSHLLQSARSECNKLEKPLSQSEVAGWV
ncbi:MAG TPA: ATP-binding protein [Thermoanaerobaculia bacterium]